MGASVMQTIILLEELTQQIHSDRSTRLTPLMVVFEDDEMSELITKICVTLTIESPCLLLWIDHRQDDNTMTSVVSHDKAQYRWPTKTLHPWCWWKKALPHTRSHLPWKNECCPSNLVWKCQMRCLNKQRLSMRQLNLTERNTTIPWLTYCHWSLTNIPKALDPDKVLYPWIATGTSDWQLDLNKLTGA